MACPGVYSVLDYDGDVAAAIGAAHRGNNLEVGTVWFPPGIYSVTEELEWKNCHLRGMFPNNSVRLIWDGPEGGTCLTKTNNSFGELSGINFRPGSSTPGRWVHLTENIVDKFLLIRDVQFMDCSIAAIDAGGWVNFHLQDIRWDFKEVGGWAIRLVNDKGMHLASFVLDRFTYDHIATTTPASGFIRVENDANSSNLGTFRVSNGRMEINRPWGGEQAILSYKAIDRMASTGPMPRAVGWHLSDMTFDVSGQGVMDDAVVLYRDTNDTSSSETLMLTNFRSLGLAELLGGTWPATFPRPSAGHYQRLDLGWSPQYKSAFHIPAYVNPLSAVNQVPTNMAHKVEVFDADGNSLGYLPIYERILP